MNTRYGKFNYITMSIIQVITNSISLFIVYERKPTVIFGYCTACFLYCYVSAVPKVFGRAC